MHESAAAAAPLAPLGGHLYEQGAIDEPSRARGVERPLQAFGMESEVRDIR